MHLDPGIGATDRRCPQIHQARRRGAHQNNTTSPLLGRSSALQNINCRNINKAALVTAIGNQRRDMFINRNTHTALRCDQIKPFDTLAVFERAGPQLIGPQQGAQDGQRERLVILAMKLDQHWHATVNTIRLNHRIEMPAPGCRLLKFWQIAAMTVPGNKGNGSAGKSLCRQRWRRQNSRLLRIFTGEIKAQNHRLTAQGVDK